MKPPKFTHADIKYVTERSIANRASKLFEEKKVGPITEGPFDFSATVQGTNPYSVSVSVNRIDDSDCTCYMGQNGKLCKHILALALAVLNKAGLLDCAQKAQGPPDLSQVKVFVGEGMKKIKPYRGPSRVWFRYQSDLSVGSGIIGEAVENLSPTEENAKYIWSLVKRLDRKLSHGVDDSDGTVGECIGFLIEQLVSFAKENPKLLSTIERFCSETTNFDFHIVLAGLINELRVD